MSARDEHRHQEMLAALGQLVSGNTQLIAHLSLRPPVNDVLETAIAEFDDDGSVRRAYSTAIGSIGVLNHTADEIIVQSGSSAGAAAPTIGRGLNRVPPYGSAVIPLASHEVTLWGTAGGTCSIQTYSAVQQPFWGLAADTSSVNGGTP